MSRPGERRPMGFPMVGARRRTPGGEGPGERRLTAALVALLFALVGCERGASTNTPPCAIEVGDESGRPLAGVLVEVGESLRAYTDEDGRVRFPRKNALEARVHCPPGLEESWLAASADSELRVARCRRRMVDIALGVLVDEAVIATVLVDGTPIGETRAGALLEVLSLPADSSAELTLVDERGQARFGPPRLLSVGEREQLFLVEGVTEVSAPKARRRRASPPPSVAPRPYRIGR